MQKKIKKPPASQNKYSKTNQASLLHIKINIKKIFFTSVFGWHPQIQTFGVGFVCLFALKNSLQEYLCKRTFAKVFVKGISIAI